MIGQGRDKEFGSTKSIEVIVGLSTLPLVIPSAPFAFPNPEMVRRIGQGGYGEIWFALNMGAYRAMKVQYLCF